jgi:hypothetical protein
VQGLEVVMRRTINWAMGQGRCQVKETSSPRPIDRREPESNAYPEDWWGQEVEMDTRLKFAQKEVWTRLALLAAISLLGAMALSAQTSTAPPNKLADSIRSGTILPVVLRTSVSFQKCKPGHAVSGNIAQDVPLANGVKIRRGTAVEGQIMEVTPNTNGAGQQVSLRFDKIYWHGQWVPIVTDLRAFASSVAVMQAHVPEEAPNEGSPYEWLPTTQIWGDSVYGRRGQVMSADDPSEVVGKSVANGVLVQVSAKEGSKCRGAADGNDSPQALWVFSSGACGIYGLDNLSIVHAGRTDPKGTIILASSSTRNVELRGGDGLLLRVQ